jgi:pyruvate kinase
VSPVVKREPLPAPSAEEEPSLLESISRKLGALGRRLDGLEAKMRAPIRRVPLDHRASALNLVHYVALRQQDLRELQSDLAQLGLSSLGRSESCVRATLRQVLCRAREALALRGAPSGDDAALLEPPHEDVSWSAAQVLLRQHTHELLGPRPAKRHIYIMVTAPSAHEADRAWMVRMLRAGMNVLRINCAHEGPDQWRQIVEALGAARRDSGAECRILMDLAGPKIRTGAVGGAHHIATWKPAKDEIGRPTTPARVVVRRASSPHHADDGQGLVLDDATFAAARRGDEIRFRDARGKRRALEVGDVSEREIVVHAMRRAYIRDRAQIELRRDGETLCYGMLTVRGGEGAAIDVRTGDTMTLTARPVEGHPPRRDGEGRVTRAGLIACTLPAALERLEVGHRVLFDEGRIEATVRQVRRKSRDYVLRVTRTQKETISLRAEKGINLPDTAIGVPPLTADDRRALSFVARHANAVSLSFVREPDDVRALHRELDRRGRADIGVVLKIETRAGFENLPRLLLEGLRRPPLGVMIARGDLAVEVGFERLAEVQEEILWLCEASHVPAIWATQVLDTLARTGIPSRAEVTDAATSVAAECVMLNKGPFVDEAVRVLSDILRRMERHRYKKRSLFRRLRVSTFAGT